MNADQFRNALKEKLCVMMELVDLRLTLSNAQNRNLNPFVLLNDVLITTFAHLPYKHAVLLIVMPKLMEVQKLLFANKISITALLALINALIKV